jgi:hypothetical protein
MARTLRQDAVRRTWERVHTVIRQQPPLVWLAGWGVLVALQILSPVWYPTHDASRYLSIARSAATTDHVTDLGSRHLVYGIGYPLLVSPVFLCDAYPFFLLSVAHAVFAAVYLAGCYVWARRHVPEAAVLIALLAVANSIVLVTFRRPLSEAAFLPVMIWAINALAAVPAARAVWRPLLAAALLLSLLAVIRQVGVLFAAGFGVCLAVRAWQRQMSWPRACLLTLVVGLPTVLSAGAMVAYDRAMGAAEGSASNLDLFTRAQTASVEYPESSILLQCLEGARVRISEVGRLTIPGMFNAYGGYRQWLNVNMLLYIPLAGLLVVGWWRFVRRLDVFALTLPLYVALYIYWPFDQSGRFFVPLVPLLVVCLWHGLARLGQRRLALLRLLLLLHTGVALGYWLGVDRPRALADDQRWPEVRRLAEVIRAAPGPVQVGPGLGRTSNLLEYLLDLPVAWQEAGQRAEPGVRWLVTAADAPPETGFTATARVGPYRLWQRH